jgi:ABC-type multidrug transport system ATPase subunit
MLNLNQVTKLQKTGIFGKKRAVLKDISLKFEAGGFYHIVGPVGCGKSTLAAILAGFISPDSGDLTWHDQRHSKSSFGYVPEEIVLPTLMKVVHCLRYYQSLRQGLDSSSAEMWSAESLMRRLGISDFAHSFLSQASVTVKRRLQLAIALVGAPQVIILDEPFYGFDDHTRRESIAILKELKLKGSLIIALSGELREFDELVDQKIVLQHGRIVYRSGQAEDIQDATSAYELELSGINQEMLNRLIEKRKLPSAHSVFQSGFQQRLRFADYEQALLWLSASVSEGIVVTQFEEIEPDLASQINAMTKTEVMK